MSLPFFFLGKIYNYVLILYVLFTRSLILRFLHETGPDAVKARRRRRFKRHCFFAAGVNDIWAMDQHDKWGPRYGLWLHNGIDPFISVNNWLKVWWTNKSPHLIAKYFLDYVQKYGGKLLFSRLIEPNLYGLIQRYHLQLRVILGPRTMVLQIYKHMHSMNSTPLLQELFSIVGSEKR